MYITFGDITLQTKLSSLVCFSTKKEKSIMIFRGLKCILISSVIADIVLLSASFSTLVARATRDYDSGRNCSDCGL